MVDSTAAEGPEDGPEEHEGKGSRVTGWFKMSATYYLDAKIMKVSPQAELIFVRMLAMSKQVNGLGRLSVEQVQACGRGVRGLVRRCDELVAAMLLSYDASTASYRIVNYWRWASDGGSEAPRQTKKSIDAGKAAPRVRPRTPQPGAPKEEIRLEVPNRTPSGSVRLGTAPGARRDAEGDARPARRAGDEVVSSSEVDPRAIARAEIEKGRKSNPAAGRKFSYRPELPSQEPTGFQSVMAKMDEMLDGSE